MRFLDLTFDSVAENLALDEALLEAAESASASEPLEVLRFWESPHTAVILGRASARGREANIPNCAADGVPVLRRSSGGCAVVIGPGCLMYSLVLSYELRPELRLLDECHRFVMSRLQQACSASVDGIHFEGTCDLTWQPPISDASTHRQKFSGNSLRCKRSHLLYHGTILYAFPLERIARYLLTPPRQPAYRAGRGHESFVTNLPVDPLALQTSLRTAFAAQEALAAWPRQLVAQLFDERYGRASWHEER